MNKHITIAIDGPAGCGKSTVAKELSKRLNIIYLDTGSMYRAVAYTAMCENIDINSENRELLNLIENISMEIRFDDGISNVFVNGENVSPFLRSKEVAIGSSMVARLPTVRARLVELQKEIAAKTSVVMDGRDIGTKVLPNSKNKFFLTASIEERSKRRYMEEKDTGISMDEIRQDIIIRDANDINRTASPLIKADDAIEIDTSSLTVEDVVNTILEQVEINDL